MKSILTAAFTFFDRNHHTKARKLGWSILLVSVILFTAALLFDAGRLHGTFNEALYGQMNPENINAFSRFLYLASSAVLVLYFVHGFFCYMKPADVLVSMLFVIMFQIVLLIMEGLLQSFALVIFLFFILFLILGLMLVFFCFVAYFAALGPIAYLFGIGILGTLIYIPVYVIRNIIPRLRPEMYILLGIMAFILLMVVFSSSSGNRRKPFDFILSLLMILFVVWPVLSFTGNISGPMANTTAYALNRAMLYQTKVQKSELHLEEQLPPIETGYYGLLVNTHDNANLTAGKFTHTDFDPVNSDGTYNEFFYMGSFDGGTFSSLSNETGYIETNPKISVKNNAVVFQCWENTLVFNGDRVSIIKYERVDGWRRQLKWETTLEWYSPISKLSEKEFRKVIMQNLLNQADHGSNTLCDMKEFVQVLYAQSEGTLLDFDESTSTAYFAEKDGNKLTFLSMNAAFEETKVLTVERNFRGVGTGCFMVGNEIYYADGRDIHEVSPEDGTDTVLYTGEAEILCMNYAVQKGDRILFAVTDDSCTVVLINGEFCKQFTDKKYPVRADTLTAIQIDPFELVIVIKTEGDSPLSFLWKFITNQTLETEAQHTRHLSFGNLGYGAG